MTKYPAGSTGDGHTGVILFWLFVAVGIRGAAYALWIALRTKPHRACESPTEGPFAAAAPHRGLAIFARTAARAKVGPQDPN